LLVAEHQTAGRGRHGHHWHAAAGNSLTFSLGLTLNPPDWAGLSLAVGVALAEALDPLTDGSTSPRLCIKWPNDLWLMDTAQGRCGPGRKLGGVLIETVASGDKRLVVVGVGLNVLPLALNPAQASTGTACLQELNAALDAPTALARVALPLVNALQLFERSGFAAFADRFSARDLLFQRRITTTQAGLPEGVAQGVSMAGALQVQTPSGLQSVSSGEVSVRPLPGSGAPC
jgi:BirA family transcriptional regulator, biotin operon repressor / biotin---[acetyl-CoA-carboxylase] ligase